MKVRNVKEPEKVAIATSQMANTFLLLAGEVTAPGEWERVEDNTPVTYPTQQ